MYFSPLAFSAWDKSAVFCARFVSSRSLISSSLIFFARLSCAVSLMNELQIQPSAIGIVLVVSILNSSLVQDSPHQDTALLEDVACRFIRGLLLLLLVDTIFVGNRFTLDCFLRFRRGTYNGASSSSSFIFVDFTKSKTLSLGERSL